MKKLTEQEIKFIKETGWTPTLLQMNYSTQELKRTKFAGMAREEGAKAFHQEMKKYGINISNLYKKICNEENSDGISLEYDATYLFYTFFTEAELAELTSAAALKWLQDFKYFCGYRKWDENLAIAEVQEALEIYNGTREFYNQDGEVWNREVE